MFHCIFNYNYGNFFLDIDNFSTFGNRNEMNTLPNMYKLFHYNLTMSPIFLVELKITPNQPTAYAVHSVEPIVPDVRRRSLNVRIFPCLLENSFSSLLTENRLHSIGFYQNLSSNSIRLILTCKLQLNCRDL